MIVEPFALYPSPKNTIYKIDIPFSSILPEEVKPGLLISIHGKPRENASRFEIDLINEGDNIIFHFNPRFTEKCVVRNSRIDNLWGNEERSESCYRVAVNGRHFIEYSHHRHFSEVKQIRIDGDVHVDCVKYRTEPLYVTPRTSLTLHPSTLYNPILPLNHNISGKVAHGCMVYISGKPFSSPYRFCFDFKKEIDDSKGIHFHFNPRFDENAIVRNSYNNGWGDEERWIPYFPFSRGTGFDMIFLITEKEFKVAINGQHFIDFEHKLLPITEIKYFAISGHVTINSVRIC